MPRKPSITIFEHGGRYVLNVPAPLSPSGKRQRLFFENRRQAELKRSSLVSQMSKYGREGLAINPALAEQAIQAKEILKPWGMTLVEAAKFAAEHRERAGASVPFTELWERHMEALTGRSDAYVKGVEDLGEAMGETFGAKLVSEIGHRDIERALSSRYKTAHSFNTHLNRLSPAFSRAVREGWATENPCRRIEKRNTGRHEIKFLTVPQSRNVILACRDFRKDRTKPEFMRKDCRPCLAAVALMLFAGVRPVEVTRLEWSDIDMDERTVRISNRKAKTDRSRFFEMSPTLHQWLNTVPVDERQGSIVPPDWLKRWKAIRRHSGISEINDALRKTFVTHHLAAFGDVNLTRSVIGHEVGDTIFSNYRGAVSKKQGLQFFEILPAKSGGNVVSMTG